MTRLPISASNSLGFPMRTLGSIALAVTAVLGLSACESEAERNLGDAQACLDRATEVNAVNVCLTKIAGDTSPSAYLLRCTGHFVAQGLDSSRITKAFEGMSSNGGSGSGGDPTMTLMAYLVFPKSSPEYANHTTAVTLSDCQASGVQSLHKIALVAQAATFLAGVAIDGSALDPSSPNFNPAAADGLKGRVDDLIAANNDASNAELGGIIVAVNSVYCAEGSASKDQDLCKDVAAAIGPNPNDYAAIGRALLTQLQAAPTP